MITPARQALEATACSRALLWVWVSIEEDSGLFIQLYTNYKFGDRTSQVTDFSRAACGAAGDARTRAVPVAASLMDVILSSKNIARARARESA